MSISSGVDALAARVAAEFVAVRGEFGVTGSNVAFSADVPAGSTSTTITHNLSTRSVIVGVYDKSVDPWVRVDVDVAIPADGNTVVLTFATAPTTGQYRVVINAAGGEASAGGAVTSVAGRDGAVVLTKADVGLNQVNNTSDADKPISLATQSELDTKANSSDVVPTSRKVAGKALTADVTLSKADVGLSNVDNTTDALKPVSTATQTALNAKADSANVVPNTRTVAGKALTADVTLSKSDVGLSNVDNTSDANKPVSTAMTTALAAKANTADVVPNTRTVAGKALSSNVSLVKADVGLNNVDNTSDAAKPVSAATQTALDTKADSANVVPNTRTVAGKPLSADVSLTKSDVGLSNVDNTTDAAKPISTATASALAAKADSSDVVPNSRTVAGKPLSANITLTKTDVGLSAVDNTSDASKPVSSATQTALNLKANTADVVPNTRTVAGKPLSDNVTLTKSDVGLSNVDNTPDASKPISTATQAAITSVETALDRTTTGDTVNRIPNSYLKDLNASNGLPAGWARNGTSSTVSVVDIAALPGAAWKLDGVGVQGGVYSPYFDVLPGEVYNYSATIRGALTGTPTVAFRVEYRDQAGTTVSPNFAANATLPGSAVSANVSFSVTIPDKAVRARVYILHGSSATAGTWYLANIDFRRSIEGQLAATSYLNEGVLKGTYLVYRVKSGSSYPARIPGAVNIFLGDTDPGLAMAENDYWANPNATTIAAVAAAITDTGSDIRKAIQNDSVYIPASDLWPEDGGVATPTILGASPNQRFARVLPSTGVTRLFGGIKLPNTWNTIRIRPHWQHTTSSATAGDACWLFTATSSPHTAGVQSGSFYTGNAAQNVVATGRSGAFAIPLGGIYSIMIARNANAGGDTFEYPIQLLGVEIIKET